MILLYLGPSDAMEHVEANLPQGFSVHLALDDESVDQHIGKCDVVLDAYMKVRFPRERIDRALNLKLFVTATTGADHINAEALAERNIPLLTLKGQTNVLRNITPAAEHSWLLLMACARSLPGALQEVLGFGWDRLKFPGVMLRGKTLGIIGCGRIGQWMARYAEGFGMRTVGYDPNVKPWPENIEAASMRDLLAQSDFISVHVPLTDETRGLLGAEEFALMKRGAIVVNTSRGDILDETALLAALRERHLAAAGLDVLSGEPDILGHPLVEYARQNQNLLITPHIGGYSPDALRFVLEFSCKRIADYFSVEA